MSEIDPPPKPPKKLRRRKLLRSALGLSVIGAGMLGWTALVEPHWLQTTFRPLVLANLPQSWNGRRVVQISDLHVGQTNPDYLKSCLEHVNGLKPDLLVITGDFVDYTGGIEDLPAVLAKLQPTRMGTLACLGNHDYGHRWSDVNLAARVMAIAQEHGIQVLRDDRTQIEQLDFIGLDDFWSPRPRRSRELIKAADPNVPAICLCHNPDTYDGLDWTSFRGIILAGHTHGGQCKPPFLPPPLLPVNNRRYTSGFIDVGPDQQLFINRGLGHTLKVRFNCRPEVTVFTLQTG